MFNIIPATPSAHEAERPVCRTVDSACALDVVWAALGERLERAAKRMTTDSDLRSDLLQEARIGVWLVDATRFDLRWKPDRTYLRRILVNRMWNVWRAEMVRRGLPDRYETAKSQAVATDGERSRAGRLAQRTSMKEESLRSRGESNTQSDPSA